jgi:hypothetical protein
MKIEFTDKGMSLIILMGIIVAIGIIGAGIVSFMDVKQRSYPLQAQSYQALNLANAGVEFAVRYAYDRYAGSKQSAQDSLGSPKTISFGSGNCGTFTIQYLGGADYTLKSLGVCGNAQREIRINKFAGYVQGNGLILTEVVNSAYPPIQGCYTYCPGPANKNASVPLTNTFGQDIYVKYIEIMLEPDQGSTNLVSGLYLDGTLVYDPATDTTNPNYMKQGQDDYICLTTPAGNGCSAPAVTPAKIPYAFNLNLIIPPGSSTQILYFKSASISGTFTIKLYYDFDSNYNNLQSATMSFTI